MTFKKIIENRYATLWTVKRVTWPFAHHKESGDPSNNTLTSKTVTWPGRFSFWR